MRLSKEDFFEGFIAQTCRSPFFFYKMFEKVRIETTSLREEKAPRMLDLP